MKEIPRWPGWILWGALVAHALLTKLDPPILAEMLWSCHVATAVMALGFLARRLELIAVGFVFHASVGWLAFVLDVVSTGTTTGSSAAVHLLPLAFGGWQLCRRRGLEAGEPHPLRGASWRALAMVLGLEVGCYFFTDPALNVNLVHAPWGPLQAVYPGLLASLIVNNGSTAILLRVGEWVLLWVCGRRSGRSTRGDLSAE